MGLQHQDMIHNISLATTRLGLRFLISIFLATFLHILEKTRWKISPTRSKGEVLALFFSPESARKARQHSWRKLISRKTNFSACLAMMKLEEDGVILDARCMSVHNFLGEMHDFAPPFKKEGKFYITYILFKKYIIGAYTGQMRGLSCAIVLLNLSVIDRVHTYCTLYTVRPAGVPANI